jgi:DNA repair exonuclease SbcCD nuclease subunit
MRILLTADLHIEHSLKHDNDAGERQSIYVLDALERAVSDERPDALVIIGDFFDAFGKLESSIAVDAVERIIAIAAEGVRVVFIAGNHDYPDVLPRFFGKSMVKALFGNLEHVGISVVDERADIISLDDVHHIVALPYRETREQFAETCYQPIVDRLQDLKKKPNARVIPCWHVGIPFGTAWRGDENENEWIKPSDPMIQDIFSLADEKTIFCGHYHGPSRDACGDLGDFLYVGSPATRSRSESGQHKRVVVWEDSEVRSVLTGLNLDHMTTSVEEARDHIQSMSDRFGPDVIRVLRTHVKLPDGASIDEYNITKSMAESLPGQVKVDRPAYRAESRGDQLVNRYQTDPDYSRGAMEGDMADLSVVQYFRGILVREVSEDSLEKLLALSDAELEGLAEAEDPGLILRQMKIDEQVGAGVIEIIRRFKRTLATMRRIASRC